MKGEISRQSYILRCMPRMQVVVLTDDGCTHVFNFENYNDPAHSHIVYKNGRKDYNGTFSNRDCYDRDYDTFRVDYHRAQTVDKFPYTFEQIFDFGLNELTEEQLTQVNKAATETKKVKTLVKTR